MEVLFDACGRRRVTSLLLIQLLVVEAAASCPKPQSTANTVLTDAALVINDFKEGIEIALQCANGYEKESGSGLISCMDGNWTEPDLICKKKDCGPPPPQPNTNFIINSGTLFGAIIQVICDKGYEISGSSFKQCYATGWIGRSSCEIVTCDTPAEVANGRHTWDSTDFPKYGESVQYVCKDGYILTGKDTIMCTETGEYDSQPPVCEGATEGNITTKTPTPPPAQKEVSTSTDSSAHRPKIHTTSATPTASPSAQGKGILMAEDTTASVQQVTLSSFQEKLDEPLDTNRDTGYTPVIVSVVVVSVVVCVLLCILHKSLLRKKGSANRAAPLC